MSSMTIDTTNPEIYKEGDPERVGEFLHPAPEVAVNPADKLSTFQMPDGTVVNTAVFTPQVPEAPATHGARMEAAIREVAETAEAQTDLHTEIARAGDAVYKVRDLYLESPANLN